MPRKNIEGMSIRQVYIQDEYVKFIKEKYPGATITWILNMLLEQFVICHGEQTPLAFAQQASDALVDTINNEES